MMAHAFQPKPPAHRQPSPWPRRHRRRWLRRNEPSAFDMLMAAMPSLPRPVLARLTEQMINRMDELAGDPDLEDGDDDRCSAGDDAPIAHWGDGLPGEPEDAEDGHDQEQVNEDDEDDDPAGGAVDDVGEEEDWRPEGIVLERPRYDVDQSLGPVNEAEVYRAFKKAQLGL